MLAHNPRPMMREAVASHPQLSAVLAESLDIVCRHASLAPDDLAFIIPHQANSCITRRTGEQQVVALIFSPWLRLSE